MMKFNSDRIGVIADLHLGVYRDSTLWHTLALEFARWMSKTYKLLDIKDIVISGDIFHNRKEVCVNTMHTASEFFKILEDFNIILVTGNHDAFYRDRADVNSLNILTGWENIHVVSEATTITHNDKKITFVPWATNMDTVDKCDIMFGHFEITSFTISEGQVCEHGESASKLLSLCPLVLTGHFHMADMRKYDNGRIIYVGSPMELSWGEAYTPKYIWVLDINDGKARAIENKISPKHLKFKSSAIRENVAEYRSAIANNFIRIQIDEELSVSDIELMQSQISALKPIELNFEYQSSGTITLDDIDEDFDPIDIEKTFKEIVDKLSEEAPKKQRILQTLVEIYRQVS